MNRQKFVFTCLTFAIVVAGIAAYNPGRVQGAPQEPIVVGELLGPETALYDQQSDTYLVSNVFGGATDRDDNGFISRVSPDGKVTQLKWIDGAAADVTLHAPKGMDFRGNLLVVADIDTIRLFDRTSGKPQGEWPVKGATFLNDVAVSGDGTIYVTDTAIALQGQTASPQGTPAVYRFESNQKQPTQLATGDALGSPNGIVATPEGPVFVTFRDNKVMRLKGQGQAPETIASLPMGQLDGIARLGDGSYVVSSWAGRGIFRVRPGGQISQIEGGLQTPAGLDVDEKRQRVIVPQLWENRLVITPLN